MRLTNWSCTVVAAISVLSATSDAWSKPETVEVNPKDLPVEVYNLLFDEEIESSNSVPFYCSFSGLFPWYMTADACLKWGAHVEGIYIPADEEQSESLVIRYRGKAWGGNREFNGMSVELDYRLVGPSGNILDEGTIENSGENTHWVEAAHLYWEDVPPLERGWYTMTVNGMFTWHDEEYEVAPMPNALTVSAWAQREIRVCVSPDGSDCPVLP